jgi:hypothetical protein
MRIILECFGLRRLLGAACAIAQHDAKRTECSEKHEQDLPEAKVKRSATDIYL